MEPLADRVIAAPEQYDIPEAGAPAETDRGPFHAPPPAAPLDSAYIWLIGGSS